MGRESTNRHDNPGSDSTAMITNYRQVQLGQVLVALVVLICGVAGSVSALVTFDFETPYLVHPGRQVWDFCLVRDAGQYHVFYHAIPQHSTHPANADTIWHAASPDLRHWNILGPALTAGPDWYDEVAMWAPDVVHDDVSGRWAMFYTGVSGPMVQRACLAWSDDLDTWTKSTGNPVFEPDSLIYHWTPTQAWSSFRDPFIYHDGTQWNMLSTAALRLGGYPGYRRGIVHRAVSPDLENWSDAGVFYEHDGSTGRSHDLESVQYVVRGGWHHLFFVEQDLDVESVPTSHMVAADPSGWNMADRDVVDAGWAPEIKQFDSGAPADVFARLAKDQDPRDGSWFVTARFDSVRFADGGQTAEVLSGNPLVIDWPQRTGDAGLSAPTFGENGVLRDEQPLGSEGQGWFSSYENYGGPLSGVGQPGAAWGDSATGRLESRPFVVAGDYLRLLLAGGNFPETCFVALLDDATGTELSRLTTNNRNGFAERFWSLVPWRGRIVRLAIVDQETEPGGWLAVDGITEEMGDLSAVRRKPGDDAPGILLTALGVWPNPFNPRTTIRFEPARDGLYRVEIYDMAGRRVWSSRNLDAVAGVPVQVIWEGDDRAGQAVASGAYLCRVMIGAVTVGGTGMLLLR